MNGKRAKAILKQMNGNVRLARRARRVYTRYGYVHLGVLARRVRNRRLG